ncbi:MAG: outer membrane lipoprotein-sorting protein [Bdellovibrionia bacterium]
MQFSKTIYESVIVAGVLLGLATARGDGLSAKDIMIKNEDARKLINVTAKVKLVTGGGGSTERTKEFTWWRKLGADTVHYNTLTRFHFPPEVKNQGILFLEKGDATDIQMYLPSFKKIRRVESQQQSGSFMGSEFSYSDIATPHAADYSHRMLKENEPCKEGEKATTCYLIESTPANDAVKERTGSVNNLHWVRRDNFMAVKSEHYGSSGELWKTIQFSANTEVSTKDHKWLAHQVRVENAKSKKFTTLAFSSVQVEEKVPDSTFTPQNLSREK